MEGEQQPDQNPQGTDLIVLRPIDDELQKSYLDYAMSVIIGRALPDVRDGLKPVHRRILYAMQDLGLHYNKAHKKCARIVGEVLGKYHPHGDQSVYDALVRMGQDFSLRTPLVDGQGNFGSLDGDPPAAMRYTEARLAKVSQEMLQDIDKETVDFVENFDGSLEEPSVLPAKLPSLLANGSSGIAVGMATNIPPHNIAELSKAIIAYMADQDIDVFDLAAIMPGPDFPTGGIIQGHTGIRQYYNSGRGKLRVRAVIEIEQKGNRERLIIKEIPYMVNKSDLVQEIANHVKNKKLEGISDIVDESDRQGMRVVIDLKQGVTPEIVENQLYHHTRCQTTFGVNMVCIVNGRPRTLGVKEVFEEYVKHRREIVRRRTEYDLRKAKDKEHLLEGLVIALDNIDAIVEFLKKTKSTDTARTGLQERYELTEKQANAILEMRLSKLTGLEQEKLRNELEETRTLIRQLEEILSSERRILDIIKEELQNIADSYADDRRTMIVEGGDTDIDLEDLIEPEDVVITISNDGYCKRLPVDTYRTQHRGGKGIIGARMKDGDFVRHMILANTHQWILVFTDQGRVYWTKGYNIPEGSRTSKGRPIINIVNVDTDERVRAIIPVKEFSEDKFLLFATRKGLLKKTPLSDYQNVRSTGIIAIKLQENDNLMDVLLTNGDNTVFLASADGQAVKCDEQDVRSMGRNSMGVKGINLASNDQLVEALVLRPDTTVLTITENGYGKRTRPDEYREIRRGGKGVRNIITSKRNGRVVSVRAVQSGQDLVVISKNGIAIRTPVEQISVIGRNTQGVKIMDLRDDDLVVTCTIVDHPDDEEPAEDSA